MNQQPLTSFTPLKADLWDAADHLLADLKPTPLKENDPGVQARAQALCEALTAWWTAHAPRLTALPQHCALNRVRAEFLETLG